MLIHYHFFTRLIFDKLGIKNLTFKTLY